MSIVVAATGFWLKFNLPELILFSLGPKVAHDTFWRTFRELEAPLTDFTHRVGKLAIIGRSAIIFSPVVAAYSNTLSPAVTGNITYGAIDSGFDVPHAPGYKVGAFAGYFALNQGMNAFGCLAIASVNCTPERRV